MECGKGRPVEEEGNHSRDSIQALDTHLNIALKFQYNYTCTMTCTYNNYYIHMTIAVRRELTELEKTLELSWKGLELKACTLPTEVPKRPS